MSKSKLTPAEREAKQARVKELESLRDRMREEHEAKLKELDAEIEQAATELLQLEEPSPTTRSH